MFRVTGRYGFREAFWRLRYILEVQVENRGVITWRDADGADIANLRMKGVLARDAPWRDSGAPPPTDNT